MHHVDLATLKAFFRENSLWDIEDIDEAALNAFLGLCSFEFTVIENKHHISSYEYVFKINSQYFKCSRYYDSWGGGERIDPDTLEEVRPVEKTVTVYEPIE